MCLPIPIWPWKTRAYPGANASGSYYRGRQTGGRGKTTFTTVYNRENPVVGYQTSYPSSLIVASVANQASTIIVAVHGLNGDAFGSFKSTINGKFWLADEDMLPGYIQNYHVLTFSYPALTSSPRESIKQHAKILVKALAEHHRVRSETLTELPCRWMKTDADS